MERLFYGSVLLLGSTIALQISIAYLHEIWPWLLGLGLPIAVLAGLVAVHRSRARRW